MEFKVRFTKIGGKTITEVTDRGAVECSTIKQVTDALGREVSDEVTGPECDTVDEIMGGDDSL